MSSPLTTLYPTWLSTTPQSLHPHSAPATHASTESLTDGTASDSGSDVSADPFALGPDAPLGFGLELEHHSEGEEAMRGGGTTPTPTALVGHGAL
jgi:hypothetical protein